MTSSTARIATDIAEQFDALDGEWERFAGPICDCQAADAAADSFRTHHRQFDWRVAAHGRTRFVIERRARR